MALEQEPPKPATYLRYADFLDGDSRRRGNALELGHDWRDGDDCYRVCWYEETGELTCERLAAGDMPHLEDFHAGIAGPIEVLAVLSTREALEELTGRWPNVAPNQPRTVRWLRELVRALDPAETGSDHRQRI